MYIHTCIINILLNECMIGVCWLKFINNLAWSHICSWYYFNIKLILGSKLAIDGINLWIRCHMVIHEIFYYDPPESVLKILYTDNLEWIVLIISQIHALFLHVWIKISNLYFEIIVTLKSVFSWYIIFIWFALSLSHSVSIFNNELINSSKSCSINSIYLSFR